MKRFHKLIGIVLSLTMITLISGCGGSSSSPTTSGSTGTLSLYITDGKPRLPEVELAAVNIKVIDIEFNYEGKWTNVNDFNDNDFNGITLNLLDWKDGEAIHLGDFELPIGHYKEIRFMLAIPNQGENPKNNPDCNITFGNEDDGFWSEPLFVPSGGTSGYKGKGEFDITANARIAVAADWDVGRAIVVTGDGKYILHPVVQLFVIELSGEIHGTVVDVLEYDKDKDELVVYAYEDGSYTDDEKDIVDEVRFLNAVSSTDVNMTDGNFTFYFLGEGNYSLVTAKYIDADPEFVKVVDVEEDVEVLKGQVKLVDVNTSDDTP